MQLRYAVGKQYGNQTTFIVHMPVPGFLSCAF